MEIDHRQLYFTNLHWNLTTRYIPPTNLEFECEIIASPVLVFHWVRTMLIGNNNPRANLTWYHWVQRNPERFVHLIQI